MLSLAVAAGSFALAWYNTRAQDVDQLQLACTDEMVHLPGLHPLPDSVRAQFIPMLHVRCDLTNIGRRPLSLVDVGLWAKAAPDTVSPFDDGSFYLPDSSVIGLPLVLAPGQTHRLPLLFGIPSSEEFDGILLLTPANAVAPIIVRVPSRRKFVDGMHSVAPRPPQRYRDSA